MNNPRDSEYDEENHKNASGGFEATEQASTSDRADDGKRGSGYILWSPAA